MENRISAPIIIKRCDPMKKLPLVVIAVLILLVLISGMADSGDTGSMQSYSDDHKHHSKDLLRPQLETSESHGDNYSVIYISGSEVIARNETAFLEENIQKSEEMVGRLEGVLRDMDESGQSNPQLKQKVEIYAADVSQARNYLFMAENSSLESEKKNYLSLSRNSIIRANMELKSIFDEIKAYLPGPVVMDNSSLYAEGSGICILSGNVNVNFFLRNGRFSVIDFSGDISADMEHDFDMEEIPQSEDTLHMPHERFSYVNVTGNISMSGSAYTVTLVGENISLSAGGTGEAELIGNGTYFIENGTAVEENSWVKPVFESD